MSTRRASPFDNALPTNVAASSDQSIDVDLLTSIRFITARTR